MKISAWFRLLAAALLLASSSTLWAQGAVKQTMDVRGQGPAGPVVSVSGATLIRSTNGITISLSMPTPVPGSYIYPPANPFQTVPPVPGTPEVFTGWVFIFNNPENCRVPYECIPGSPSTGPQDFPADLGNGGAYNFAGHAVSGGGALDLVGHISKGEAVFGGVAPLMNPTGAEVHVAVAPHGVLVPELLPEQLNTPVGSPPFWWIAIFDAP
jgi:hypothetical protein